MIKVVVTGVECTGKTVLAQSIQAYYDAMLVPEFARGYLEKSNGIYSESDLLKILDQQLANEKKAMAMNPDLLVCDTGPYVIKVWSKFKYGRVDEKILNTIEKYQVDLFILPDYREIPFVDDPLRENPNDREVLFQMYLEEMTNQEVPFLVVSRDLENRLRQVKRAVDGLLGR